MRPSIHWFAIVAVLGFVANASADPIVSDAGFSTLGPGTGHTYYI